MRFSLKWLLAGMAYVALIAAAYSRTSWLLVDAVWLVAFLAFGYGMIVCRSAHGEIRIAAFGFVAFSALFAGSAQFAPASLPSARFAARTLPRLSSASSNVVVHSADDVVSGVAVGWAADARLWLYYDPELLAQRTRLLNSAGTMLAGLIGGALATLAYRRHGQRE
jgi:hypothetical protein